MAVDDEQCDLVEKVLIFLRKPGFRFHCAV